MPFVAKIGTRHARQESAKGDNGFMNPNRWIDQRRALEDAGVEFIPAKSGNGVGIRLRDEKQIG
jgi:hypothetical protein